MTNLDKLNKLFDDYLTKHRKSFISLRTGNDLLKNSKDPDLQNIDLKKLLESGMIPHSGQTTTAPKQWRIFSSKKVENYRDSYTSNRKFEHETEFVNPIKYNSKTNTFSDSREPKGKYEYNKIAIIGLIITGGLIALFTWMKSNQDADVKSKIEIGYYSETSEDVNSSLENIGQKNDDIAAVLNNANSLYNELLAFKGSDDFHYYGFSGAGKYNSWLKRAAELKNSPHAKTILLDYGFALGDIEMLGLEYVKSKGRETEYSNWAKSRIENGLKN